MAWTKVRFSFAPAGYQLVYTGGETAYSREPLYDDTGAIWSSDIARQLPGKVKEK
jgi:hypothetical protein